MARWIHEQAGRTSRAIALAATADRTSDDDGLRLIVVAMALGMMVAALI